MHQIVKVQFDACFILKAPIFNQQPFNTCMLQVHSVLESTYYTFQTLAMLSFSVILFYSAIEICFYSLYRKKMISAFELNKRKSWDLVIVSKNTQWFVSHKPSHLAKATILYDMLYKCMSLWACANDGKILHIKDELNLYMNNILTLALCLELFLLLALFLGFAFGLAIPTWDRTSTEIN